jgi:hypothetical protein
MMIINMANSSISSMPFKVSCLAVFFCISGCIPSRELPGIKNSALDSPHKPLVSSSPDFDLHTPSIQSGTQNTFNIDEIENAELLKKLNQNLVNKQSKLQFRPILERRVSSNRNCYMEIVYPRLIGLKDGKIQAHINDHLDKLPEATRNFYHQRLERSIQCKKSIKDKSRPFLARFDQCQITFAGGNFISLKCHESYGAGLYPILSIRGMNLNIRTGKIYQYPDLFNQNVDYIEAVRKLIQENDIPPALPESMKSEFYSLNHKNADFYLSSSCDFPSKDDLYKDACLVISKPLASGVRQQKTIQIKMSQINKILSSDPDLQILLK